MCFVGQVADLSICEARTGQRPVLRRHGRALRRSKTASSSVVDSRHAGYPLTHDGLKRGSTRPDRLHVSELDSGSFLRKPFEQPGWVVDGQSTGAVVLDLRTYVKDDVNRVLSN